MRQTAEIRRAGDAQENKAMVDWVLDAGTVVPPILLAIPVGRVSQGGP